MASRSLVRLRRGLPVDGRLVPDLESSGLAGEAVQAAAGLVDDLGRRVHALALREGQLLAHDGHSLGRRDLEDEVDGGPQIEVQFGGHDALHRSILACRIGCSARRVSQPRSRPARERIRGPAASQTVSRRRSLRRTVTYPRSHARARTPPRTASVAADRRRRARRRRRVRGGRVAAVGGRPRAPRRGRRGCRSRRTSRRPPLALPEQPRVLIFGDSWVYGSAAIVPDARASPTCSASELGWDTVVDGVRGSGYLKPGTRRRLLRRAHRRPRPGARPRPRDRRGIDQRPAAPGDGLPGGRDRRVGRARRRCYPEARDRDPRPGSAGAPGRGGDRAHRRRPRRARRRTRLVVHLADRRGVDHARQLRRASSTPAIGRDHPSTGGHAYLATRLAEALATHRARATDVVADAPHDEELVGP